MRASKHKYAAFQIDSKQNCAGCSKSIGTLDENFARPNKATYAVKELGKAGYIHYCLKHVQEYAKVRYTSLDEMLAVGRYLQGG